MSTLLRASVDKTALNSLLPAKRRNIYVKKPKQTLTYIK